MYELAKEQLDPDEARYLRIAMAAKLVELTSYRPYELKLEDCQFIRASRGELATLSSANIAEFNRMVAAASARLIVRIWQKASV
jgi:hypothetical protein